MRKVLTALLLVFCAFNATAENSRATVARATMIGSGVQSNVGPRGLSPVASAKSENAPARITRPTQQTQPRMATSQNVSARAAKAPLSVSPRASQTVSARAAAATGSRVIARAAESSEVVETRTGAEYDRCKSAYFACMDQFCATKNHSYQRCSCSDKIYGIKETQATIQGVVDELTVFNENLDTVGMTAAQASAMRKASEGENALAADKSASKSLLNAIMGAIKGDSTSVGGKYSSLNSVNIDAGADMGFGSMSGGQSIADLEGKNLYTASYNQCKPAVASDCSDAALQRAVTAYLMAVEQDCNTVQKSLEDKKKTLSAATRESGAMLNLARVENRQKHNSNDAMECLKAVEQAILSDQVCGAGYKKCLDNGEFIDVTTGKPFQGKPKFYELEDLLKFDDRISIADQRLTKIRANKKFVENFISRTKQFAMPVLDKCTEKADQVWADYLDKAMVDIYYAQKAKVEEIQNSCIEFVAACYSDVGTSISQAMSIIMNETTVLTPGAVGLNAQLCKKYVDSCDKMFPTAQDEPGIFERFVSAKKNTDLVNACRAVVRQCFERNGGMAFENLYNPYNGVIKPGRAMDWFTFWGREYIDTGSVFPDTPGHGYCWTYYPEPKVISPCAQQLIAIKDCNPPDDGEQYTNNEKHLFAQEIFGGFDMFQVAYNESFYSNDHFGNIALRGYYNYGLGDFMMHATDLIDPKNRPKEKQGEQPGDKLTDGFVWRKCEGEDKSCLIQGGRENLVLGNCLEGQLEGVGNIGGISSEESFLWTNNDFVHGKIRPKGVATELFYELTDKLSRQCYTLGGAFKDFRYIKKSELAFASSILNLNMCVENMESNDVRITDFQLGIKASGNVTTENRGPWNMCPTKFTDIVDTRSWGKCSCWNNGGMTSNNGQTEYCTPGQFMEQKIGYVKFTNRKVIVGKEAIYDSGKWVLSPDSTDHFGKICPGQCGVNSGGLCTEDDCKTCSNASYTVPPECGTATSADLLNKIPKPFEVK